uniref:Uncharacterized protein n=1 Tax=Anguilla anguilla TaxID=7936 RepID=A0A0E9P857_ANGAN
MLLLAPSQNAVGHRLFFPSEITRPHVIPPLTPVRETARVTFSHLFTKAAMHCGEGIGKITPGRKMEFENS